VREGKGGWGWSGRLGTVEDGWGWDGDGDGDGWVYFGARIGKITVLTLELK
jgi:hypothetical protein